MEWNSVVWVCFFGCWVLLCSTWKAVLFVWWVTFNRSFKYFLLLHLIAFWKASIYYRTRLLFIVLMHFFQKKLRWLSVTEINWNQWNCFYFESNYFWIRNLSLRQDPNKPLSLAPVHSVRLLVERWRADRLLIEDLSKLLFKDLQRVA